MRESTEDMAKYRSMNTKVAARKQEKAVSQLLYNADGRKAKFRKSKPPGLPRKINYGRLPRNVEQNI